MRSIMGVLALVIAVPAAAQQVEVTLQEAVRRSLDVQPAMVQARGAQRSAGASTRTAFGAFLPTLTTGASAARSNVGRIDQTTGQPVGPEYSYTGSLNASLELFDGFRRFANLRAASATGDAAAAGTVNQRFQVTLATKQVFYNALATEDLVRVAESQVVRARQQLQISVEKLHAGSATRSDSLRSTVDYGNARIALLQARANLASAQANLGRQIGIDSLVRAVPDSTLPALPDSTGLRAAALENSPQVIQAQAQAHALAASVWDQRSQYLPTLSVTYTTSSQGLTEPWQGFTPPNRNLNQLRFGLSWTIFNGFAREQQLTSSAVQRDVANARTEDTRRQVNAALTQQFAAAATAFEQIDIARANLAAATEDLRVQNERYRVGAATILDLLTSQAALTQAEVNVVQTRFNYLIARAQVEAVVGRTL